MSGTRLESCNSSDQTLTPKEVRPNGLTIRPSSKIRDRHLDRLAIVYVRQSSPHQVLENRESRERQYSLAGFARQLGWPEDRVLLIDEDQGVSGKEAANRSGFQRLLTEVSMNHVGIVLALELRLVGLLSIDDVLDLLADEFRQIGELLKRESPGSLAHS